LKVRIHLLFPFDMGLELDFTGPDAKEFLKDITTSHAAVLSLDGHTFSDPDFSTQVYRFGVGMIHISFSVEGDMGYLARLSCQIDAIRVENKSVIAYCHSLVGGLIDRAGNYATYHYERRLTDGEIFPIFELAEPLAEHADEFISKNERSLFGLLAGEEHFDKLSKFVMQQEALVNYGYYENEIVLIKRFGAVVFSDEDATIIGMIKLAFARYWSLRSYNYILDHEMETSQKLLERLPPYYRFWRILKAYQLFSSEAMAFDRDKISIVDSLYNVVSTIPKVEASAHLRSLHSNVNTVFNIESLHRTVETKISRIAESYNSAREFLSNNFFIMLNIIFLLTLIWSILDTFLLWKLSVK